MITKNVKLYLAGGFPVRIPVSQFDTAWEFVFTIIKDGLTWEIPSGASAVLNGLKPDGNVFAFAGTISGNTVTVDCDVQMTAVAGDTICELSILATEGSEVSQRAKVVGTANFILAVEAAPKSPDDVSSDSTLPAYAEMLEMFSGDIEDEVDNWLNAHSSQIGGLTNEAKQALLTLLAHVAYTDDQGQTYLDALETALYPPANLVSISAVFTQGGAVIRTTDSLDTLKQYLTVTALYSDSSTEVVTSYTLSGTLTVGTSTITVAYGGKTTTFNVTVSAPEWDVVWTYADGSPTDNGFTSVTGGTVTETLTAGGLELDAVGSSSYVGYNYPNDNNYSVGVVEVTFMQTAGEGQNCIAYGDNTNRIAVRCQYSQNYKGIYLMNASSISGMTKIQDMALNTEYTIKLVMNNGLADVYINGTLVQTGVDVSTITATYKLPAFRLVGTSSYTHGVTSLKSFKIRFNRVS